MTAPLLLPAKPALGPRTPDFDPALVAASAANCLLLELETYPKPGLVSHVDSGSHDDMEAATFRASAAAIEPFFGKLAEAGADGAGMSRLRIIGLEAEAAMRAAKWTRDHSVRARCRGADPSKAGSGSTSVGSA
ncbi:triphosphoribosyl-dephospho-CoA synthase, partial [Hansschlegelia beijingensis]